jgi:hypothetical protein
MQNSDEAAAAVSVLPELQSLCLSRIRDEQALLPGTYWLGELPLLVRLTQLSYSPLALPPEDAEELSELSSLFSLGDLKLSGLPEIGVPGGLPSQLVKLACLDVSYSSEYDAKEQFQHLSSLTALRQLSVTNGSLWLMPSADLSGIQHLTQLTGLELRARDLDFSTASTSKWPCLTALQSLSLEQCTVQRAALQALTQLQVLSLESCHSSGSADSASERLAELLHAVARLSRLSKLRFVGGRFPWHAERQHTAAAAFTALTASTNLCYLQPGLAEELTPPDWQLLSSGTAYRHLRVIDLTCVDHIPPSQQQL